VTFGYFQAMYSIFSSVHTAPFTRDPTPLGGVFKQIIPDL
jgi:hypothetical protein